MTQLEFISNKSKEKLCECLDQREIYWIDKYDTYYGEGYNETYGGQDGFCDFQKKHVLEYDLGGNLLTKYDSVTDAEEVTGFTNISLCCMKTRIYRLKNRIYRFEDDPLTEEEINWYKVKFPKIFQYTFDGILVNTFDFIKDAEIWLSENNISTNSSNIAQVCNGNVPSAGGFIWRKYPDAFNSYEIPKKHLNKVIEQRNPYTGELLNTFTSFVDIKNFLKISSYSSIVECCNKNNKTAQNFYWCYKGEFDFNDILSNDFHQYLQFDKSGKLLNQFDSQREIEKFLGRKVKMSNIKKVCDKKLKTAYGYIWEIKDKGQYRKG
jgi:hypothetical protein